MRIELSNWKDGPKLGRQLHHQSVCIAGGPVFQPRTHIIKKNGHYGL